MTDTMTVETNSALSGAKPPGTPRKKKKGTLAKLAERKRRASLVSETESNFGSKVSLSESKNGKEVKPSNHSAEKNTSQRQISNIPIEPIIVVQSQPSVEKTDSSKPTPKPRHGKKQKHSDQGAPVEMEIEERDSDEDKDDLKGSQTDATMHRFRNLRMATERSGSVESLKSSPFMPKPPTTPKKSARESPKGEKRSRDPNSSGEEHDQESKRHSSEGKEEIKVNTADEIIATDSQHVVVDDLSKESVTRSRRRLREHLNKEFDNASTRDSGLGHSSSAQTPEVTYGSISDLRAVTDQYEAVLAMDKDRNLTPRSSRLPPLSPKSHPPPIGQNVSATSLRTAYKTDLYPNSARNSNFDCTSERSICSTSIMSAITTKQARERNFLVGNSSTVSLMGSDELERFFPNKDVHVWVGTWNMNEKKTMPDLNDFLLPKAAEYIQDIYCVSTQENALNKREWELKIQETLGPSHVMLHSAAHGSLHIAVFIRRDLIWYCSVVEDDFVTTRAMTMVRTKGSIACSFSLFGSSYLFLNCHFTSNITKKEERLVDYTKIIQGLKLPRSSASGGSSQKTGDVTANFDSVFFSGDLNFRIEWKKHAVEGKVDHIEDQPYKNYEHLLAGDQLSKFITEGRIFQGFQEGRINFKPSYKFDPNSDRYDTSNKSRIPSYTDRILFRCRKKNWVQCIHYDSVMSIQTSDHKPVFAIFETCIKPGKEGSHLAGGLFDRSIYLEGNKRRALHMASVAHTEKASSVCSLQ